MFKFFLNLYFKYNPVTIKSQDVLGENANKELFLGEEKIDDRELESLVKECLYVKDCKLWKILTTTLRQKHIEGLIQKDNAIYHKSGLYNIDLLNDIINRIEMLERRKEMEQRAINKYKAEPRNKV